MLGPPIADASATQTFSTWPKRFFTHSFFTKGVVSVEAFRHQIVFEQHHRAYDAQNSTNSAEQKLKKKQSFTA